MEPRDPKSIRIVYMGTPDFAVEPLRVLLDHGYNVAAVVTMPDKPAGRGLKLKQSAVKEFALSRGLAVLQPEKLRDEAFLSELTALKPDLGIVVAFRMLPKVVWDMPELGTFNLHASLLPDYRGAAPINRAIMNGDRESGITTFMLNEEIDKGAVIAQERVAIGPDDDAGTLHDNLMVRGGELVRRSVDLIARGEVTPLPQPETGNFRPAPKIFKVDCLIEWDAEAEKIRNKVRGLSPYPAAWCELKGETFKVYDVVVEPFGGGRPLPGTIGSDGKNYVRVAAKDAWISLRQLQLSGKKRMEIAEFLRGNRMFD